MAVQNPNWPVMDYAISFGAGPAVSPLAKYWTSVADRTEGKVSIKRGKQYELDQTQPGQLTLTLRNDDGAFDPSNASSLYWPGVVPYSLFRVRAQWPPTVNLLTGDQATASFTTLGAVTTSTLPQWVAATGTLAVSIAPLSGSSNKYVLAAGGVVANTEQLTFYGFSVAPGQSYAAQFAFTSAASASLAMQIDWYSASGLLSSTVGTTVTGLSGTCTVAAAVPAGAIAASVSLVAVASPTAAVNVSAVQVEKNASASAFVVPSTWYPIFTGYVERWPQTWTSGGNYGVTNLTVVDLFAWAAGRGLNYAGYLEVMSFPVNSANNFFYPLDESAGATSFRDLLNLRQPATLYTPTASPFQTIQPGNGLQATGGYLPVGTAPQVVSAVPTAGQVAAQLIDITGGGLNFPLGSGNSWSRMLAFRVPKTPSLASTSAVLAWTQQPGNSNTYMSVQGQYDASGNFNSLQVLGVWNGVTVQQALTSPVAMNLSDGGWHLLIYGADPPGTGFKCYLDGVAMTIITASNSTPLGAPGSTDVLGGQLLSTVNTSSNGPACDLAFFAQFVGQLTPTQSQNMYEAFRYGWGSQSPTHDETSDARYARLLAWAGFTGVSRVSAGSTVLYGPAVDLQGGTSPTALLSALQNVVTTENGQHFVGRDGAVVFQARTNRYNQSSLLTFGELTGSGEVPYLGAATDFDPTRVANDVTVTAEFGGTTGAAATSAHVLDSSSGNQYGDITMGRTINTLDQYELPSAAQYLLYQNKQPHQRLEQIAVDVASNPALWSSLLPRELGDPVTVNRRPSNAPAITVPGFLEQITWDFDDKGRALFSAQVSNSALHQFAQFDSATYGLFDSTLIFGY